MKSLNYRALLSPAVVLVLAASLAACTHENPLSLQLQGNLTMVRQPGAGQGVTGQCYPNGETIFRPNGVFDLMVANRYEFFPSVENLLPPLQSINGKTQENLQLEPQTIMLEGAQVTLEMDTTTAGPLKPAGATPWRVSWFSPFVAQIKAGGTVGSRFTLIPSDVGEAMRTVFGAFPGRRTARQQAIVKVRVIGRMADGTVVESNTVPYPVDICWGCLVSLPVAIEGVGVDPEEQYKICSSKAVPNLTPPCMPGNDEFLPCQFYCFLCDQDNSCDETVCPAL